ncbi:hypothetical protein [Marispirochaeta sp.]|uniref:hypothetical protein n=1 Tax=Marispirochaeta sp. TaxID=2038653 RepID=UPI0029C7981E|nr:hypothetical protein [Marispirochaeta sp.]
MVFKEHVKYKEIISFCVCIITFFITIYNSASIVFLIFSVYYLFNAVVSKTVKIEKSVIIVSTAFKKVSISVDSIIDVRIIHNKMKLSQFFYLGILYLLLDYSMEEILIKTNEEEVIIPLKYFDKSLYNNLLIASEEGQ